jgi:hypothetical protein
VWLEIEIVASAPASVADKILPGEVQEVEIASSRLTVLAVLLAVFAVLFAVFAVLCAVAASAAASSAAA